MVDGPSFSMIVGKCFAMNKKCRKIYHICIRSKFFEIILTAVLKYVLLSYTGVKYPNSSTKNFYKYIYDSIVTLSKILSLKSKVFCIMWFVYSIIVIYLITFSKIHLNLIETIGYITNSLWQTRVSCGEIRKPQEYKSLWFTVISLSFIFHQLWFRPQTIQFRRRPEC